MKKNIKTIFNSIVRSMMNTKPYKWIGLEIVPNIRFSTRVTDMRGKHAMQILNQAKPGDFILCSDKKKLISSIVPGELTHAALIVENYNTFEMTHENFKVEHILDILYQADYAVLCRIKGGDSDYALKMVEYAKTFSDAKYDVKFKIGPDELYCSELIYHADFEHRLEVELSTMFGEKQVTAVDLFFAKNCEVIYSTSDKIIEVLTKNKRKIK
jgi:hypothetical protein